VRRVIYLVGVVMTEHKQGYRQAIQDMKDLLDNALANGDTTHIYEDIIDQLDLLWEEYSYDRKD
jgi:hypothetical protein